MVEGNLMSQCRELPWSLVSFQECDTQVLSHSGVWRSSIYGDITGSLEMRGHWRFLRALESKESAGFLQGKAHASLILFSCVFASGGLTTKNQGETSQL